MVLFLDFDGVLHPFFPLPDLPDDENALFSYWPRLMRVLNDFPFINVVISSSWRTSENLMTQVPESLRRRIVGHTPEIKRRARKQYPANFQPEPIRYLEILRYLKTNKQESAQWIALDDDPLLFPAHCPQLLLCPKGFGEGEEMELRRRLEGLLRGRFSIEAKDGKTVG